MFFRTVNHYSFPTFVKQLTASAIVLSGLLISANASAEYKEVRRLGTSQAICKPGINTSDELQAFFAEHPDKVQAILNHAGWSGDEQLLFDAVAAGDFTEKQYEPGTTFQWMSAIRKGKAVSLPKRVWAGKTAFDGFEVNVVSQCVNYQMVIPKDCCNLSLATTSDVQKEVKLTTEVSGDSLTVCTDLPAQVSMTAPNGESQPLSLNEVGCWTGSALAAGNYAFQATDDCGTASASAVIAEPSVAAASKFIPFIAPFIGSESLMRYETRWAMDMDDSSGLVGVRAGVKYAMGKGWFLVPTLGVFTRTSVNDGIDYPEEGASLDLGVEKYVSENIFVGAGLGAWNIDDSDFRQSSAFVNVGGNISNATEWFVELRGIDSDNVDGKDGYSDNHAYNAGIRYKF